MDTKPRTQAFAPTSETLRDYRNALGQFATGVTVVTCMTDNGPLGMTANSFSSVSLEPALVLWSPSKTSSRYDSFLNARHYAIHILSAEQADLCMAFAKQANAFDQCEHIMNAQNVPLIENCLARFECTQYAVHDAGDHSIILGHVDYVTSAQGAPLIFAQGKIV